MALRCKCGMFITKSGVCNRCNLEYTSKGLGIETWPIYLGSDGIEYLAVNNRLEVREIKPIPKEEKRMSFFSFDEKQAGGFDPLEAGEYEAVISKTEVKTSQSGNPMISVQLTIRNDVDQPNAGRKVFDNYVATPNAMFKFHQVAKALGWGQGESADTLDDFAAKILYKAVRLKIGTPKNDPQRGPQTNIQNYLPAEVEYVGGGAADPFTADGRSVDISDDDLPF